MRRQNEPVYGTPLHWLTRARSALTLASVPVMAGVVREDLAFQAQQAAEKALKAVFLHHGLQFRYTHNLAYLIRGLASHGVEVPDEVRTCVRLTDYAFQARYPGESEPMTQEDLDTALAIAEQVVVWATSQIEPEPTE